MQEYKKLIQIGTWSVGSMCDRIVMRHGEDYKYNTIEDIKKYGCGWWMWHQMLRPRGSNKCASCGTKIPDAIQTLYMLHTGELLDEF